MIVPIGEWVLREACAEAMHWPENVSVGVNLSPVQFRSRRLVEAVRTALASSGLSSSRLELEITEAVLMMKNDAILHALREFRAMGARIAMDDFGTGYSSLSYLRSFPFDKIKIDRSFVHDLTGCGAVHECEAAVIIRAIASLGTSLRLGVTAEGVETDEQLAFLAAVACTEAQGYLFSPPVPAHNLEALLAEPHPAHGATAGEIDMLSRIAWKPGPLREHFRSDTHEALTGTEAVTGTTARL